MKRKSKRTYIPICPLCGGETDDIKARKHNCSPGNMYSFKRVIFKDQDGNIYLSNKRGSIAVI